MEDSGKAKQALRWVPIEKRKWGQSGVTWRTLSGEIGLQCMEIYRMTSDINHALAIAMLSMQEL